MNICGPFIAMKIKAGKGIKRRNESQNSVNNVWLFDYLPIGGLAVFECVYDTHKNMEIFFSFHKSFIYFAWSWRGCTITTRSRTLPRLLAHWFIWCSMKRSHTLLNSRSCGNISVLVAAKKPGVSNEVNHLMWLRIKSPITTNSSIGKSLLNSSIAFSKSPIRPFDTMSGGEYTYIYEYDVLLCQGYSRNHHF